MPHLGFRRFGTHRTHLPHCLQDAASCPVDLSRQSDAELIECHAHANEWFSRHARIVLQDRAYRGRLDSTTQAATGRWVADYSKPREHRLRALVDPARDWRTRQCGLGRTAGGPHSRDPWLGRATSLESGDADPRLLEALQELARTEREAQVRRELISALQRVGLERRIGLAKAVLSGNDGLGSPQLAATGVVCLGAAGDGLAAGSGRPR